MIVVEASKVAGRWSEPPHHRELKILISPALQDVGDGLSIGMVLLPPGESGDVHKHDHEQETWFVLSGRGKLRIGAEVAEVGPETLVVAPPGVEHQILNDGEEFLRALFIFTPAGPEESYMGGVR